MKRAIVHSEIDRENLKKSKNKHSDFNPDFAFDTNATDDFANVAVDFNGFETAMGHAERRGAAEIPGRTSLDSKIAAARVKRKLVKKPTKVDDSKIEKNTKKIGDAIREKKVNKIGEAKKNDEPQKYVKNEKSEFKNVDDFEEDEELEEEEEEVEEEDLDFQDLKLNRALLKAINELNWEQPSPIQKRAIPVALRGGDITACATTGSGKTGAFMIPIIERLSHKSLTAQQLTRALIIVPTRELAVQVHATAKLLSKYSAW